MICVSLSRMTTEECLQTLKKEAFAEIRIDTMDVGIEQIKELFSFPSKLIATCRQGRYNDQQRKAFLKQAIEAGANYVDIEVESNHKYMMEIMQYARMHNCKIIVSYHNFEETPGIDDLVNITTLCFEQGADYAKIVTMAEHERDVAKILSLYTLKRKIIAFAMGEKGKLSRIIAPLLGAEFSYASPLAGKEAAPGQIDKEKMAEIISLLKKI